MSSTRKRETSLQLSTMPQEQMVSRLRELESTKEKLHQVIRPFTAHSFQGVAQDKTLPHPVHIANS